MASSKRFKQLAERLGYKIVPVSANFNGQIARRPDIMAVEKHGVFVMTIPANMYPLLDRSYRDLVGIVQPSYFDCEDKLYKKHYA